ncbi:MAG: 30S ribosomal protein S20 [Bacilli bacterium]|jgi:small subunit ribosomal protein S20
MANIKSQKKRIEIGERNRLAHAAFKSQMRTAIKKVKAACANNDKATAETLLTEAVSLIDKSVKMGIQHINTASRQKSSLMSLVNGISEKKPEAEVKEAK